MRAVLKTKGGARLEVGPAQRKVRRHLGSRVRQVEVRLPGEFVEPARLVGLIELCRVTLDRLASAGSASTEPVDMDRNYGDPVW